MFGPLLPCNFFQFSNHMIEGVARKLVVYNEEENDQLTQSQDIICKERPFIEIYMKPHCCIHCVIYTADFITSLTSRSSLKLLPIAQVEINTVTPTSSLDHTPSKKCVPFIYVSTFGREVENGCVCYWESLSTTCTCMLSTLNHNCNCEFQHSVHVRT